MTTNWVEEGTLADLKHRLDKLRVHQSKQTAEDEPRRKDTLKILQSKFGSPVYDPTSPLQKAYERSCARSGRRKSIEFEDLYLKKGSGLLQLPPSFAGGGPKSRSGGTAARKHPLFRSSSGMDYSDQLAQLSEAGGGGPSSPSSRSRKSSDPSSHSSRRGADPSSQGKARAKAAAATGGEPAGGKKGGQGHGEGHRGQGQGQRGILSMRLSEEERRAIDRKLEGEGDVRVESRTGSDPVVGSTTQGRRKVSKTGSRP